VFSLFSDVRYSIRVLSKYRSFTAVAVLTLALGIGANTAIFSMADAIISRPFPFKDLNRIVTLWETIPKVSMERYGVSSANYFDWKELNHVFDNMTAYKSWSTMLTGSHEPEQVQAYLVLPSFFRLLDVPPLKGRFFSGAESHNEATEVVVSFGFWRARLGADPNVLGRVLSLNGLDYTVIGVMPKEFDFPMYADIWTPWIVRPEDRSERSQHSLSVLGRLKPGVSLSQAQTEMDNIGGQLAREYPLVNAGRSVGMMLLRDSVDQYARRFLVVVAGAVAFLLLLACANVANLQLARGASRQKEMAIRVAMGASRGQLVRQQFTEGLLLSLLAAGLGLPFAVWGLAVIKTYMPQLVARHISSFMHAQMDARMLAFTLAAAIVTGIASTVPAAFQGSSKQVYETLKEGGRSSSISGRRRMRSALVVSEIAFAIVLLICAGLMVNAFRNLARMNQGFDPDNVVTFDISLPESKYLAMGPVTNFYKETLRRLGALPKMQSPAVVSELPALGDSRSSPVVIEGRTSVSPDRPLMAEVRVISEDYFRAMAMPIRLGRAFTPYDNGGSLPVAIISEGAALRFWPGLDPLGRRVKLTSTELKTPWLTVVGIVGDVRYFFLDSEVRPTFYVPYLQQPIRSLNFVMRTEASMNRTVTDIRGSVQAVDSTVPVYAIERISRFFTDLAGGVGVIGALMGVFAMIALALAAAGIYAVMAYSVAQRTEEIGIRMALGAQSRDIWKLVVGNATRLLGIGLGLGLPVSLALGHLMTSVLSGVVALEPLTFLTFTLVLSAAGLLAGYLPARRAAKVDPLVALRNG
jgi:putative ABC transport system permease protein